MQIDIEKREDRGRTFDCLKETFELKESRKGTISRSSTPIRNQSHTPLKKSSLLAPSDDDPVNAAITSHKKRKLKPNQV